MKPTRREFLSSSTAFMGGGWLWLNLPALAALSACARDAASRNEPFHNLDAAAGRAMRAFAARIIPSGDGLPGAEEAGAVWFVDAAMAGRYAFMKDPIVEGLADLDARSMAAHDVAFADASPDEQDALMRAVEATPFFVLARMLTVMGTFSDPSHGGNRDHVGFRILDMEHAPAWQPPFGWYDAQYASEPDVIV